MRKTFDISGLWCATCAKAVERSISRLHGVSAATVTFVVSAAQVEWDDALVSEAQITAAVSELGYQLIPARDLKTIAANAEAQVRAAGIRVAVGLFFSMWSTLAALPIYLNSTDSAVVAYCLALLSGLFALPVLIVAGHPIFKAGWRAAKMRSLSVDLVIALGTTGAIGLSIGRLASGDVDVYFDSASMMLTLLSVARLVEIRARTAASLASDALLSFDAGVCDVVADDGSVVERSTMNVGVGRIVRCKPLQSIVLDGRVTAGNGLIDRSMVNGESLPVPVSEGCAVEAGAKLVYGAIDIEVTAPVGERAIDLVALRLREALVTAQGDDRGLASTWLKWQSPVSLALAALAFAVGLIATGDLANAAERTITTLLVTCPCLLTLASPLVRSFASQAALKLGAEVRRPANLEWLGRSRLVIFDKTGTLARSLGARFIACVDGERELSLAVIAASAELESQHPYAVAIRAAAKGLGVSAVDGGTREEIVGGGVTWKPPFGGEVIVGSKAFLVTRGVKVPFDDVLSAVFIAIDGRMVGRVEVKESLDPDFVELARCFSASGISWGILSGDAQSRVDEFAKTLPSLGRLFANGGCSPEEKSATIARLKPSHAAVTFIGDGANDGASLATASAGIAIGSGSNAALASAGIVVSCERPLLITIDLLNLANQVVRITRQNRLWALGYNLATVPAALAGLFGPSVAIAAMAASSSLLVANSLRVLKFRGRQRSESLGASGFAPEKLRSQELGLSERVNACRSSS